MSEYIDKKALLDEICRDNCERSYNGTCHNCRMTETIADFPAADVVPVRHGRWIKPVPGDGENYCSVCKAGQPWFYGYGYFEPDYCPNCGARMDGKEQGQ